MGVVFFAEVHLCRIVFFENEVQPITVHDLHATILHLLGLEHTKLTYAYQGRQMRLTDVYGNVIKQVLA